MKQKAIIPTSENHLFTDHQIPDGRDVKRLVLSPVAGLRIIFTVLWSPYVIGQTIFAL